MAKKLVEDCRKIETRQLPKGETRSVLRWQDPEGELEARALLTLEGEAVDVFYRWRDGARWLTRRFEVALKRVQTHTGGAYWQWRCPGCERPARALYEAVAGRWACRRCGNLVPRSNREKSWQRALRRAAKIRGYCGGSDDLSLPFPPRPATMKQATYDSLREEAGKLEAIPPEAWIRKGENVALGIRRDWRGASKPGWWPGRDQTGYKKANENKG